MTSGSQRLVIELRDPVHGGVPVRQGELRVIDTPLFQRLRGVRQLGFGEHVFPGAVHHRYLHSIGAMHLAGEVAAKLLDGAPINEDERVRLIQVARLAALLHDVGHPPLSHAAESLLPSRRELLGDLVSEPDERASHEDMTAVVLTRSPLTEVLDRELADVGVTAQDVAAVIADKRPARESLCASGIDFGPLLHQLVSGELDVDRMDYLLRDSYFTGVRYGTYDRDWLVSNLLLHIEPSAEGQGLAAASFALLAIDMRALPAFEHFLLARYHMFQMVYYHPISDAYDATLRRWLASVGEGARIPGTMDEFVRCNDAWLRLRLEASDDPWAKRIVDRKPIALLAELRTDADRARRPEVERALGAAGVEALWHTAKPVLSRYAASAGARIDPLLVIEARPPFGRGPRVHRIEEVTDLFDRYERALRIERVYVRPEDRSRARAALAAADI
jgi:hypothetical protein